MPLHSELEARLYEHREADVIFQIYHPRVFSRATALSFDICHHLETVTWQTDPHYVKFYENIPAPVTEYVERIKYLGRPGAPPEDVRLLAAHAYVRYLGDLSGGQLMKRRLIKAYGMYDDGEGFAFYNFRTLDPRTGDRPAEMHEVRKIKDWFRRGIDEGVTSEEAKGTYLSLLSPFVLSGCVPSRSSKLASFGLTSFFSCCPNGGKSGVPVQCENVYMRRSQENTRSRAAQDRVCFDDNRCLARCIACCSPRSVYRPLCLGRRGLHRCSRR